MKKGYPKGMYGSNNKKSTGTGTENKPMKGKAPKNKKRVTKKRVY